MMQKNTSIADYSPFSLKHWVKEPIELDGASHLVQFYENKQFLCNTVTLFVRRALEKNEGIVVMGNRALIDCLHDKLQEYDLERIRAQGQVAILDTKTLLSNFIRKGTLQIDSLKNLIRQQLETILSKYKKIYIYGEVVDALWQQGNASAAIQVENLWNEMSIYYPVTLLCGYNMLHFDEEFDTDAFRSVCRKHSHILPAESFLKIADKSQ